MNIDYSVISIPMRSRVRDVCIFTVLNVESTRCGNESTICEHSVSNLRCLILWNKESHLKT
jgi:hypothetical protein